MASIINSKNFIKSLRLLYYLVEIGSVHFILCPGNRSAPLALAAGELSKRGIIKLFNSIDERSAGFHALGISCASDQLTVVITTSGTAVANLLPSAVEADISSNKVIFLTADRPKRLKNCGSNQTVNQEYFLKSSCRTFLTTNLEGLHLTSNSQIIDLVRQIYKINSYSPGPIHLNIPFEEPLVLDQEERAELLKVFEKDFTNKRNKFPKEKLIKEKVIDLESNFKKIELFNSGLIIVGPYRGSAKNLLEFNIYLEKIQNITGWPVFADPVSGINANLRGLVQNWELIISNKKINIDCEQIFRLGPISSSKCLEDFLKRFEGHQYLIKENDSRSLDPLKKSIEYDFGLKNFVNCLLNDKSKKILSKRSLTNFANDLIGEGERINAIFKEKFSQRNNISECSLASLVPTIWPKENPIMLSASSPIRDWLTFSGKNLLTRRCFSFRGASGIDGTLSMALGIARVTNPLLLVTGDLAFLHDINGCLIENFDQVNLTILLIDNEGGNIFNRLHKNLLGEEELKKLFIMHKDVKWENLFKSHQIPFKQISKINELEEVFEWSISNPNPVIIRAKIKSDYEINERNNIFNYINEND